MSLFILWEAGPSAKTECAFPHAIGKFSRKIQPIIEPYLAASFVIEQQIKLGFYLFPFKRGTSALGISRNLLVYLGVALIASISILVALKLNVVPEHDEQAYVTNAMIYSGVSPHAGNPSYSERPPLFWWLLTALLSLGADPRVVLAVSPTFAVMLALLIVKFSIDITGETKVGLFAGLACAFSAFFASMSSRVLTDAMGSFFALLSMYAFYKYFIKKQNRIIYAPIFGASLALSLIARDENMIMLPLFVILWIFFALKATVRRKILYVALTGLILGVPTAALGMVNTLQLASNLVTPIVLNFWPYALLLIAVFTYFMFRLKKIFLRDAGIGLFLFLVFELPFWYDNYVLGNILYYIAGKGILARPISHLMMIPQTGGVGAQLPMVARASDWIKSLPSLLSIALVAAALIGIYAVYRFSSRDFAFLGIWLVTTLGYVVFGTHLEDRFLMIAFAPIMIFAGIGLGFIWGKNRWLGVGSLLLALISANIIPRTSLSPSNVMLYSAVFGADKSQQNWLFSFLPTVPLFQPNLQISPIYLIEGVASLAIAVSSVLFVLGAFKSIEQRTMVEVEPPHPWQLPDNENYEDDFTTVSEGQSGEKVSPEDESELTIEEEEEEVQEQQEHAVHEFTSEGSTEAPR
ncbi:MAG TPA: glycosyltransferase family 39 protein [Nitrososphaerales archaeon]|nr:glycosyltransferase family 39 protein [Nitrososphaerales archaeon]